MAGPYQTFAIDNSKLYEGTKLNMRLKRLIPAVLLAIVTMVPALAHAQSAFSQTTLATAISSSQRNFSLASVSGITPQSTLTGSYLYIDRELVLVLSVSGKTVTTTRGVGGTQATGHISAAAVLVGNPTWFHTLDPAGSCTPANLSPWVNVNTGVQWTCPVNTWVASGVGIGLTGTPYVINVKQQPYNAFGDAQKVIGNTVSTSPTITSSSNPWVSGDVGKIIWCNAASGATSLAVSTITAFNSAGSITASNTATASGGVYCVWGHDDSAAIKAASIAAQTTSDDAEDLPFLVPSRTVYVPPGGYIVGSATAPVIQWLVSSGNEQAPSLVGGGMVSTTFFPRPDTNMPATGGWFLNAYGPSGNYSDFGIDGSSKIYSYNNLGVISFAGGHSYQARIRISQLDSNGSGNVIVGWSGQQQFTEGFWLQDFPAGGQSIVADFNGASGDVYGSIFSNGQVANLVVNNVGGGSSSGRLAFWGTIVDECPLNSGTCTQITSAKDVYFTGTTLFGDGAAPGSGGGSLSVDGTSEVRISESNLGAFAAPTNSSALQIASGGKVWATTSEFRCTGTGTGIVNAGTYIDVGGNKVSGCTTLISGAGSYISSLTHSSFNAFQTSTLAAGTVAIFPVDQQIQISSIAMTASNTPSCTVAPTIRITDGTTTLNTSTNFTGQSFSQAFTSGNTFASGGSGTLTLSVNAIGTCTTAPTNANFNIRWSSIAPSF